MDRSCAIAPLTPPPTASLNVGHPTIDRGQSTTLMWNTANATTVSIDNGIGPVAASGTLTVSPTLNTFYTLTATGTTGSVTATAFLTVRIPTDITWNPPANIVYGTPLSATQLNATVQGTGVFGSFAYSPVAGTILPAGTHSLSVTFTPDRPGPLRPLDEGGSDHRFESDSADRVDAAGHHHFRHAAWRDAIECERDRARHDGARDVCVHARVRNDPHSR